MKQIRLSAVATLLLLVAPCSALPGTCCDSREVQIRAFCIEGTGADGPTTGHEISWYLQGQGTVYYPRPEVGSDDCDLSGNDDYCDVPEQSCTNLPNAPYQPISSLESLDIQVREHDDRNSDDWTRVTLETNEWHLGTCEEYEIRTFAKWGSQRKEEACIDANVDFGLFGLAQCDLDVCAEDVVHTDAYEWKVKVRPYQGESGRRLLDVEADLEVYNDDCGGELYNLSVHVEDRGHLFALASPSSATASNCPFLATHAVIDTDETNPNSYKELLTWTTGEEFEMKFAPHKSIEVGSFPFSQLTTAFQQASVPNNRSYDILSNNCGSLLVQLSTLLGVPIDSRIKDFVASRILQDSSRYLATMVRENLKEEYVWNRNLRMGGSDDSLLSDQEVIELLIEKSTQMG